ncbi:MAG: threonylcarbamoyl-AMP synthase [Candidatus Wallbacteria bacterium]|nr:threonylcarbamoyl-AMP synthase [Candidatus Wallbacteria bacterium]
MLLRIHPTHPQERLIDRVLEELLGGALMAYPTDTVYGLGCDMLNKRAVERVYAVKRMDRTKPLALLCNDLSHISEYALVSDFAYRVMKHLVPGPYTFVLPATRLVPKVLETRRKTVGIRVPSHPIPLAVIRGLGHPIVSSSCDPDGAEEIMNDPEEIDRYFGNQLDLIIDGGPGGLIPSTVIDLTGAEVVVVREGKGDTAAIHG